MAQTDAARGSVVAAPPPWKTLSRGFMRPKAFDVLVALLAPLLADRSGLEVTQATGGVLEPPGAQLELTIDTTAYMLSAGDSFFFKNHPSLLRSMSPRSLMS